MSEVLSIVVEMILAFGLVAVLLAADHGLVTRLATRRTSAATVGADVLPVQSYTGGGVLGAQELKGSRKPAEWTVIKGLRDARA